MAQKALAKMNKEELINKAKEIGVYTEECDTMAKADLIALIKGKEEEPTQEEADQAKGLTNGKVEASFFNMRTAIAGAFKAGNRHAITKDEAFIGSATDDAWKSWKIFVEQTFYDAVREYYVAKVERKENRQETLDKAFGVWRSIIAVGNESKFHKNMYIEDGDIEYFFAFIQTRGVVEGVGGYWATVGRQNFRKEVEFLVGARMAQAAVASDSDHELIVAYTGKERTITTMTERLEGRTGDDGHHEPGLNESIEGLKRSIAEFSKNLKEELKATDEQVGKFTAKMNAELADLEKQKKSAEGSIKDAQKFIAEKKTDYEAAVERCGKPIDDVAIA